MRREGNKPEGDNACPNGGGRLRTLKTQLGQKCTTNGEITSTWFPHVYKVYVMYTKLHVDYKLYKL